MSSTTPAPTSGFADTSNLGTPAAQGGSPPAEPSAEELTGEPRDGSDVPEVTDVPVSEETQEQQTETPAEEPADTGGSSRVTELEEQLRQRQAIIDEIAERMERDPELAAKLGSQGNTPTNWLQTVEETLFDPENGLKREAAEVVLRAFKPALTRLQQLEARFDSTIPQINGMARALGSTEFQRTLTESGIAPEVQKTNGFQKFIKTLRADRRFASMEAKDPSFAADHAASKWQAQRAKMNGWKDDRARLETIKNSRNGNMGTRTASTAEKVFRLKRAADGSHLDRAFAIRYKNPGARVEYED